MAEHATPDGLERAKEKLRRFENNQVLADRAEVSRATVQKFLAGKGVGLGSFKAICNALELPWEEIAGLKEPIADHFPPISDASLSSTELENLVQRARKQGQSDIEQRCGWMKVLDMQQPIGMSAIYTDVNILEKITGRTRRELDELMQGYTPENFDRFLLGQVREERVGGLEAVRSKKQLMILGRPGAGKTTFLKRLATLCNQGTFLPEQVPIFVTLKEFAETLNQPGLLNFIAHYFAPQLSMEEVDHLIRQGCGLVLLDGLDEVLEKDHDRVLREIREFSQQYAASHIVITCRIAAREYVFEQFTDVEMADFSDQQIFDFADKWFKVKEPDNMNEEGNSTVAKLFWEALEARKPIKELATNPLLLTLLCLEFEQSVEFPQGRAELYERSLNVLLSKWDGQRRIKREEVYRCLPIKRKESLLGQLARYTFERGDYFFREHKAKELIGQYIQNLPDASTNSETLLVDSYAVLKSIEAQHGLLTERATGIYSFSHLTFHEYFTAKNILDVTNPADQQSALQELVRHINEKRWREVFLLVAERMDSADYLLTLMKQQIDQMLAGDETLQEFLTWVEQKSRSVETLHKPAAIRAFYLDLAFTIDRNLDLTLSISLAITLDIALTITRSLDIALAINSDSAFSRARNCDPTLAVDIALARALTRARVLAIDTDVDIDIVLALDTDLNLALDFARTFARISDHLKGKLEELQEQLPDPSQKDWNQFTHWWRIQSQSWVVQLREALIEHRNIGHNWQFNGEQKEQLRRYNAANLLLVNCLNNSYVTKETRKRIETELLLPIKSIS